MKKRQIDAEIKQIIDGEQRPMQRAPSIVNQKAPLPKSAKWHMRHRPYLRGGDTVGNQQRDSGTVLCDEGGSERPANQD